MTLTDPLCDWRGSHVMGCACGDWWGLFRFAWLRIGSRAGHQLARGTNVENSFPAFSQGGPNRT